jgi:hypothetical protein
MQSLADSATFKGQLDNAQWRKFARRLEELVSAGEDNG